MLIKTSSAVAQDTYDGTPNADVYNGTEGNDTAHGADGNDTLNGKGGADILYGDAGDDTISGGDDIDAIHGGAGADHLSGDGGDDNFIVDDAGDLAAGETIDGGAGNDQLLFQFSSGTVDLSGLTITGVERLQAMNAYLGTVSMTAAQLSGFTSYLDVFTIQLTSGGSVTIGSGVDGRHINFILANAATTLDLRNDPSNYGSGVTGGSADDVIYGSSQYADHISGGGGNDSIYGGSDRDGLSGGDGNDHIEAGGNDDQLSGGDGNDELYGGSGYDVLDGGAGLDKLYGGDTDDSLVIGSAGDVVVGEIYDGGAGEDTLTLTGGGSFDLSTVSLVGIERLSNTYGTAILSTAQIANGITFLSGMIAFSTSGAVTLNGSYDNVNFVLNAGGNSVDASGAATGIRVTGSEVADTVVGSAHNDTLSGGGGVDTIDGGAGNDILTGGAGADVMHGGAGNDVLVYNAASDMAAGEVIDGGADFDILRLESFSGNFTLDLTGANMTGIEGIDTGPYDVTAKLTAAQFDALTAISGTFILTTGGTVTMAGVIPAGSSSNGSITLSAAGNTLDMTGYDVPFTNIFGQDGVDIVIGSTGSDNVYARGGNDTVNGGDGNDIIHGGAGADQMSGGDGDDFFVLDAASEFAAGESYDGGAGLDILQLSGVFTVDVSAGDLTKLDGIDARFGTVQLTAAQLDALTAVTGNFVLTTSGTVSMSGVVNAANGISSFTLSSGGNTFDMTGYTPTGAQVNGGAGNDTVIGSSYSDVIFGNGGDDTLIGNDGNDRLDGGKGSNAIDGGAGIDNASFDFSDRSGAVVLVNGGATGVTYAATVGGAAAGSIKDVEMFSIVGGSGDDRIGGHYIPALYSGDMRLDGGAGTDTAVVDLSAYVGTVSGSLGGLFLYAGQFGGQLSFTLAGIEAIDFTGGDAGSDVTGGALADSLRGGSGNDVFNGGGGDDVIIGAAGDDLLTGGAGNDQMYGGSGNDSYFVDAQGDLVFENADQGGTDTVVATASYYLYANIERLTLASGAGDIFGVGNDLDNLVAGNEGANLLLGGGGNDEIHGGAGNDQLYGQDGEDTIYGDAGVDYLIGGAGNDILSGGADTDALYGEDGNDLLWGGDDFKTDILIGGAGNDTLRADSGLGDYDELDGGAGDDIYIVDTYADVTYEAAGGGTDTVQASTAAGSGYYLYANVENLLLIGNTFYGVGNELANTLTGNALDNWLLGGAGNDLLNGKAGNDVLFGQDGADTFVFEHGTGGDTIADFTAGTDRIDLSAFGFTSFAQLQTAMSENAGSTAINLGGGDFIVLQNVANASLHEGDFILSGGSSGGAQAEQLVRAAAAEESGFLAARGGLIHEFEVPGAHSVFAIAHEAAAAVFI